MEAFVFGAIGAAGIVILVTVIALLYDVYTTNKLVTYVTKTIIEEKDDPK